MVKWRGRLYTTDRARDFDHEHDRNVRIRQIYQTIDRQPYQWIVVFVAGIGFFLDGKRAAKLMPLRWSMLTSLKDILYVPDLESHNQTNPTSSAG